jgi:uncharacterized protein
MKQSIGATRFYQVDEAAQPETGDVPAGRVLGSVRVMRTDRGVWVNGRLDTAAVCQCSRCLREYHQPVCITIDDEFAAQSDGAVIGPWLEGGEEGFFIGSDQILDITEAVRQYSYLSIPMKPTCRNDCAGLCTGCGANLNETACSCGPPRTDPRWDALLKMVSTGGDD